MAGCCARACTAAVLLGVMRLPGCPFDSAWRLVCEVCRLAVGWVVCRRFLSFVFPGGARRLEVSPCNTAETVFAYPACGTSRPGPGRPCLRQPHPPSGASLAQLLPPGGATHVRGQHILRPRPHEVCHAMRACSEARRSRNIECTESETCNNVYTSVVVSTVPARCTRALETYSVDQDRGVCGVCGSVC